jgi:pyruvate/2-oxoglutarate dehydrogenase complex dihydrolipoamide acyltransferase (E2) component
VTGGVFANPKIRARSATARGVTERLAEAGVTQPVDSSILHEIVRIIDSRRKVPAKVIVKSKEYLLTYLEDHQRRLEEAMSRYDRDLLNMLYGQLASKIKYQVLRRVPASAAKAVGLTPSKPPAPTAAKPAAKDKPAAKKAPAKKAPAKKPSAKAAAKPKPKAKAKPARRAVARPAKKKAAARR